MEMLSKRALRIAFLIMFSLCLFGFALPIHAFQNEPDGFGGILWGTPINAVADRIEKRVPAGEMFSMVTLKNENLKLGGAELSTIQYIFRDGRFFSVLARTEKAANFEALKTHLFNTYGPPDQPNEKAAMYQWKGEITSMRLIYRPQNEEVFLEFSSTRGVKDFARDIEERKRGQ